MPIDGDVPKFKLPDEVLLAPSRRCSRLLSAEATFCFACCSTDTITNWMVIGRGDDQIKLCSNCSGEANGLDVHCIPLPKLQKPSLGLSGVEAMEKLGGGRCEDTYDREYNPRPVLISDRKGLTLYEISVARCFHKPESDDDLVVREKLLQQLADNVIAVNLSSGTRSGPRQILMGVPQIDELRSGLTTLKSDRWLNDTVINCYFQLLQDRDTKHSDLTKIRPSLFLSTFVFESLFPNPHQSTSALDSYNFERVKRWFLKLGPRPGAYTEVENFFLFRKIFIPLNHPAKPQSVDAVSMGRGLEVTQTPQEKKGVHWALLIIEFKHHSGTGRVVYWDTKLKDKTNGHCPYVMLAHRYIDACFRFLLDIFDRSPKPPTSDVDFNPPSKATWEVAVMDLHSGCPQQENDSDCGVILAAIADYIAVDHDLEKLEITDGMDTYRAKMLLSLIEQHIVH